MSKATPDIMEDAAINEQNGSNANELNIITSCSMTRMLIGLK